LPSSLHSYCTCLMILSLRASWSAFIFRLKHAGMQEDVCNNYYVSYYYCPKAGFCCLQQTKRKDWVSHKKKKMRIKEKWKDSKRNPMKKIFTRNFQVIHYIISILYESSLHSWKKKILPAFNAFMLNRKILENFSSLFI
jgi:hypothetical protein